MFDQDAELMELYNLTFSQRRFQILVNVFSLNIVTVQGQLNCCSNFFPIIAFNITFVSDVNSQSCKLENRQIDKVLVPTINFRIGSLPRSAISPNSALGKNVDWSDS